jgi:16S rRNA (adenine1518-N6/adenine1519-N6)-dimethyltransferase
MNISELKEICQIQGIRLTQQRGQNLLIDARMLERLALLAAPDPENFVIEIGAALGNWTEHLAKRAKRVFAIELDRKLFSILAHRMQETSNVEPIHSDVMKFDFHGLFQRFHNQRFTLTGNLPYNLTSQVLFLVIDLYRQFPTPPFHRACFMVQKEVAQRMAAPAGSPDYGRLTAALAYSSQVKLEKDVPRQCFFPVPRVDSAFVSLNFDGGIRENASEDDAYEWMVRTAFSQRRKQAIKLLANSELRGVKIDRDRWESIFGEAEIDLTLRGEAISPSQFLRLTRLWIDATGKK